MIMATGANIVLSEPEPKQPDRPILYRCTAGPISFVMVPVLRFLQCCVSKGCPSAGESDLVAVPGLLVAFDDFRKYTGPGTIDRTACLFAFRQLMCMTLPSCFSFHHPGKRLAEVPVA